MQAAGIHHLELTLLFLVLLVAGLTTLAQRFKIPYPIVLFMGGVVLSLFHHLPQIALNPDVVFLVVLPPLLFIGGFNTSWRDFHKNIVSILMLAFGLVGFTVFGVAVGSAWLIPGFDYRLGAVLGAVVSTTDAIAATSIAKRLGLPRRIVDILEGESLVNDASGLLALQFSVALVVAGTRPGPGLAVLELLWLVAGGVAIGLFRRASSFTKSHSISPTRPWKSLCPLSPLTWLTLRQRGSMRRACSPPWSAACTSVAKVPRHSPSTRVSTAPRCGRRWSSASTASSLF